MIIVTGGAGFIGSNLIAALNARGRKDIILCDHLGMDDKWRNLARRQIAEIVNPEDLFTYMREHADGGVWGRVEAVFHMGANSSTTESDVDLILSQNFRFSLDLWRLCAEQEVRLIYASSAATYGDGRAGFADGLDVSQLDQLKPLNPYGWSKHLFDQRVAHLAMDPRTRPPQYVGLKFFNVYGPNEYHKGLMKSVVAQKYPSAELGKPVTLFRSYRPDCEDGGQRRDFIYVRDCADVILWLFDNPEVNGLFNLGTGQARSFADLAKALFSALGKTSQIQYIDMPSSIRDRYQYFTEAQMLQLRSAGYSAPFTSLEAGISDYINNFLATTDPYL